MGAAVRAVWFVVSQGIWGAQSSGNFGSRVQCLNTPKNASFHGSRADTDSERVVLESGCVETDSVFSVKSVLSLSTGVSKDTEKSPPASKFDLLSVPQALVDGVVIHQMDLEVVPSDDLDFVREWEDGPDISRCLSAGLRDKASGRPRRCLSRCGQGARLPAASSRLHSSHANKRKREFEQPCQYPGHGDLPHRENKYGGAESGCFGFASA